MVPAIQKITIKASVEVMLLLTPSLFAIAKERGVELSADAGNQQAVMDLYTKIIWLAALNYHAAARMDDPSLPDFPFAFLDFAAWRGERRDEFARIVEVAVQALTGKSLADIVKDDAASGEKKN